MGDLKSGLDHWRKETALEAPSRRPAQRVDIVIGLDFGTRFTKVAYRILEIDEARIVLPDAASPSSGLFESVLFLDGRAHQVSRRRERHTSAGHAVPYLKLLLKDVAKYGDLLAASTREIIDEEIVKLMSAFYLAGVLREAIEVIGRDERQRLEGKQVSYALNLSLPAAHREDDAATDRFREVGAVALQWAVSRIGKVEKTALADLDAEYRAAALRKLSTDVEVFSEIVAALHPFIIRRDTPDGIHGFLDIGAGTVDGCVFRLYPARGRRGLDVLGAKVESLGTVIVAREAAEQSDDGIERELVTCESMTVKVDIPLRAPGDRLSRFIGELLQGARSKSYGRKLAHSPAAIIDTKGAKPSLPGEFAFLICGGGFKSGWYRGVVSSVYEKHKLANAGTMRYRCESLSPPVGFDIASNVPYERFVIAHGLTHDAGDLSATKARLPKQIGDADPLPFAREAAIGYLDTKELT